MDLVKKPVEEVGSFFKMQRNSTSHQTLDITHKRVQTTALQLDGSGKGEFILRPSRVSFKNSELDSHRRLPAPEERRNRGSGQRSE
jgi:hypothetical protein